MNRFGTLTKLNIKKVFHSIVWQVLGAIGLVFLTGAITFCSANFLTAISSNADSSPINLAVVMYDESVMAQTISGYITSNEEISSGMLFDFVDETTAMRGLETGTYIAAVIIPTDAVDSIMDGTNTPIQIVFPENSGLEAVIIKEIADAAATLLSSAQAGIYSVYDIYEEYGASQNIDKAVFSMNLKYISFVVGGSRLFEVTETSSTGSLSSLNYYICAGIVLFMLLIGVNYLATAHSLDSITSKKLSLTGTPFILQELSGYISIVVGQLVTLAIVALPAVPILNIFGISISMEYIGLLILVICLFTLVSSGCVYIVSRISRHSLSRIMITFISTLIMCFISGCFVPSLMLPEALDKVGKLVPTTYMMEGLTSAMCGTLNIPALLGCIGYSCILLLVGICSSYLSRRKELR